MKKVIRLTQNNAYLKGGFGSGFVYVAANGTNYIITNRHVVSQAASASVEFENAETGDITKYENLSVLLTDDEIDIAILGFANGEKPFKRGLSLSSANVSDGLRSRGNQHLESEQPRLNEFCNSCKRDSKNARECAEKI